MFRHTCLGNTAVLLMQRFTEKLLSWHSCPSFFFFFFFSFFFFSFFLSQLTVTFKPVFVSLVLEGHSAEESPTTRHRSTRNDRQPRWTCAGRRRLLGRWMKRLVAGRVTKPPPPPQHRVHESDRRRVSKVTRVARLSGYSAWPSSGHGRGRDGLWRAARCHFVLCLHA